MIVRRPVLGAAALLLAAFSLTSFAAEATTAEMSSPAVTSAAAATTAETASPAATADAAATTAETSSPAATAAAAATTAETSSPAATSAAEATTAEISSPAATSAAEAATAEKPSPAVTSAAAATTAEKLSPQAKLAQLVAAARATRKTPANESFDKYQVVVTNNIFTRVHPRIFTPTELAPAPIATALSPEQATVLRGIVRQGDGPNAAYFVFLEDLQTHQTTKMPVGEPVCAGKLVNPTLESVDYLKNGVTKRITVGMNLTGAEPVEVSPPAAAPVPAGAAEGVGAPATASSPGVTAKSGSAPPVSLDSIAEQMRQKRLKDLGK